MRPHIDTASRHAVQHAIAHLARHRIADPPDSDHPDPGDALHLAWSLSLQIDAYLPELIDAARDHGHTWDDIDYYLTPPTTP